MSVPGSMPELATKNASKLRLAPTLKEGSSDRISEFIYRVAPSTLSILRWSFCDED